MNVGRKLKERYGELGWSRAELARRAEVDPKTVQSLEQGERWPQEKNRVKIERALGWAPGSLEQVRDGGEPTPLPDIPPGQGTAGASLRQLHETYGPDIFTDQLERKPRDPNPEDSQHGVEHALFSSAVLEASSARDAIKSLPALSEIQPGAAEVIGRFAHRSASEALPVLIRALSIEGRSSMAFLVLDLLKEEGVTLTSPANDDSRRAEGSSADGVGGEARKEMHTDRMSSEELRDLADTDEAWGGYVESKTVRPESEL